MFVELFKIKPNDCFSTTKHIVAERLTPLRRPAEILLGPWLPFPLCPIVPLAFLFPLFAIVPLAFLFPVFPIVPLAFLCPSFPIAPLAFLFPLFPTTPLAFQFPLFPIVVVAFLSPRESRPLATAFFLRQIQHNLALLVGTCRAQRFMTYLGEGMSVTVCGRARLCLASMFTESAKPT